MFLRKDFFIFHPERVNACAHSDAQLHVQLNDDDDDDHMCSQRERERHQIQ